MATTILNGKPRKQLADQLDRLDNVIDALADGLPAAVRDAVQETAGPTLKAMLLDLLSDPDVLARLIPAAPAEHSPAPKPSLWARLRSGLRAARAAVASTVSAVRRAVARAGAPATAMVADARAAAALVGGRRVRVALLVSALAGVTVAGVAYMSHPLAALSGAGAAVGVAAAQAALWARSAVRAFAA